MSKYNNYDNVFHQKFHLILLSNLKLSLEQSRLFECHTKNNSGGCFLLSFVIMSVQKAQIDRAKVRVLCNVFA